MWFPQMAERCEYCLAGIRAERMLMVSATDGLVPQRAFSNSRRTFSRGSIGRLSTWNEWGVHDRYELTMTN